jgi:hypothetical protein
VTKPTNASTPAEGVKLLQAAAILSRLERREITASQVRTILVLGPDARAMQPLRRGEARVFTAEDLAVVRVVLRLRACGVSPVVSRVIVANRRDELIRAWHDGLPQALGVIGMRALLLWRGKELDGMIAWVDLPDVWRAIPAAIAAAQPTATAAPHDGARTARV